MRPREGWVVRLFLFSLLFSLLSTTIVAQSLNVATFNIRYSDGDKGTERCWENRRDSLSHFLLSHDLDIIGMQEVLHGQMTFLSKRLSAYGHIGVGRDDGHKAGEYAPIFYRKSVWKCLKSGVFWLSETPDVKGSKGWDAACTRIATWALLRHRESGKTLIFINTHFDHIGHTARIESARLIMRKTQEIAADTPFILTGDFNVDASDEVYTTITADKDFPVIDSQKANCPHTGASYTYHNFARIPAEQCSKIDFIFTSPTITTLSTYIPAESRTTQHPFCMSDHNPVLAKMSW